ncbi:hypothetical protein ACFSGI_22685 [Paenibacillus nicotianae]|uniref:AbiEi antitoxin C-terminal domain-containing protein n=1 Tax=Paenibacillus nicotianae TaxID=1526551 RepID=A0ABW4V1Y0_9BACL
MDLYKEDIKKALITRGKVFSPNDLKDIFANYRQEWRMPGAATHLNFIDFLVEQKKWLTSLTIPRGTRYVLQTEGTISAEYVASHIFTDTYLSHYSAVDFHGLTREIIKTVFTSREHSSAKYTDSAEMDQERINYAFSKKMRKSNQYFEYNKQRIYLLSSKDGEIGIQSYNDLRVSTIERTLIDIAVRPEYCGGVYEVLNVFINAKGKFSANKLRSFLLKLKYAYPYHQCIGFYLELAGYPENIIKLFKNMSMKFDFYLTYNIENPEYNENWRIYYPKNFAHTE